MLSKWALLLFLFLKMSFIYNKPTNIIKMRLFFFFTRRSGAMFLNPCTFHLCLFNQMQGWQWGRAGPKDEVFIPAPHGFILPHPCSAPHDGENFLFLSSPLGALRNLTPPSKTLLFVNLPYNQYNFFNETYFINKNIIEISTKFIPSNQINFQKKLNNISKRLTRQSPKKKKNHSITYVEGHLWKPSRRKSPMMRVTKN